MQTRILGRVLAVTLAAALAGCSDDDCTFDADCGGGQVCISRQCQPGPTPVQCAEGRLACATGGDCASGSCEAGCCTAACASKLDCKDGEECRSGLCKPGTTDGCASDADCSGNTPRCLETTKSCVSCLSQADCGDARECGEDNRCRLQEGRCLQTSDCARTPASPVCDTSAKSCVRCLQDLDCGGGAARCVERQCVTPPENCTWDSDCAATPGTPRCDVGTGDCVACARNSHCDPTEQCNLETHVCEPLPSGCGAHADCASTPETPRCRTADRTCVACVGAADCPGGRCLSNNTCGTSSSCAANADCAAPTGVCGDGKTCVECTTSAQCGAGRKCSQNLCVAETTGCAVDTDCGGATPKCRTSDRTCVGCLARGDCGALQACTANRCVAGPCGSNAECAGVDANRPICNSTSGACVECTQTAQCGQYEVCTNNACVLTGCGSNADCGGATPKCRADRQCVACLQRSDCGPLQACNAQNQCVAGPCATNAECASVDPAKGVCDTGSGACVQCTGDAQCTGGEVCRSNRCVSALCTSDADCGGATPRCRTSTGACVACTADAQCSAGQRCGAANTCEALPGLDQPCNQGLCPAGLDCVTDGTNDVCRLPCDLYAPRCATDRFCTHVGWDGATPEGACVPTDGGAGPGQVCSGSTPCREDLLCIYESATSGRCRTYCDPAAATGCASPNKCQPLVDVDHNDVPRTFGGCFPDTKLFDDCGDDAACNAGQVCQVDANPRAPTELANICGWPVGTKTGIAGCDAHTECRTGLCVSSNPTNVNAGFDGHCQKACDADADCPTAGGQPATCASVRLPWYDATGALADNDVNTCVPPCAGEHMCGASDTCGLQPNATGTRWASRCWPASVSSGLIGGGACANDSECWSGVCLKFGSNTTDGICQGVCDRATGDGCGPAGECAPHGVLRTLPGPDGAWGTTDDLKNGVAPLCWGKTCDQDSDCAGQSKDASKPRVCMVDRDPRDPDHALLRSCKPRLGGALNGGQVCANDSDCGSGWCISWLKSGTGGTTGVPAVTSKRCFATCVSAADCASGSTCGSAKPATNPSRLGNDGVVNGCVPVW